MPVQPSRIGFGTCVKFAAREFFKEPDAVELQRLAGLANHHKQLIPWTLPDEHCPLHH
jgi:hypothetical protein